MTTDQVNYVNIGLMLLSVGLAIILPFELFLFSYAVLGPLHYLTEISWLSDRKFFSEMKYDWVPLAIFGLLILMGSKYVLGSLAIPELKGVTTSLTFAAFGTAFLFILVTDLWPRVFGGILLLVGMLMINNASQEGLMFSVFTVYLPTMIHVYVFTGAFILFGALKRGSKTGYFSILVFLCCPLVCLLAFPGYSGINLGMEIKQSYEAFAVLNQYMIRHANLLPEVIAPGFEISSFDQVFNHPTSILVTRVIAFAYTYHYLNWFSKTSIIQWHKVPKVRFAAVLIIWVISVVLYARDYQNGFRWLFLLSFLHVFLEFPLNHKSFIGIWEECQKRIFGKSATSVK